MTILQTDNLTLCACTPGDCQDFIDLELDPDVMKYLNGGAVDHATTHPDKVTFYMPRGTERDVWTARRTDGGAFVGWFCLSVDNDGTAEIGYRLRKEYWGRGYGSEGASALIDRGFRALAVEKVVACTMALNAASRRVMEKIGMRHVATVPVDSAHLPGSEEGEVWYELTRRQWTGSP